MMRTVRRLLPILLAAGLWGCEALAPGSSTPAPDGPADPWAHLDGGVDHAAKVVHLGVLGPTPSASPDTIYADRLAGLRLAMDRAAEPGNAWLQDGWTVRLHVDEHDGSQQGIQRAYRRLSSRVATFASIHDARAAELAVPWLQTDGLYGFPDEVTQALRAHRRTPMIDAPPALQAQRALDYSLTTTSEPVRSAVVFGTEARGRDAQAGWTAASAAAGAEVVAAIEIEPRGPNAERAAVAELVAQGATHILLATRPGVARNIIAAAADSGFRPAWIGISTTWNDVYFRTDAPSDWSNYRRVSPWPWWGEPVPGAAALQTAWDTDVGAKTAPGEAVLVGWVHAQVVLGAIDSAIANRDVSRLGIGRAITYVDAFDAGGMVRPISLSRFPYSGALEMRVLKPNFAKSSWDVVSPWAAPAGSPTTPTSLNTRAGQVQRAEALKRDAPKSRKLRRGTDPMEIVSGADR